MNAEIGRTSRTYKINAIKTNDQTLLVYTVIVTGMSENVIKVTDFSDVTRENERKVLNPRGLANFVFTKYIF